MPRRSDCVCENCVVPPAEWARGRACPGYRYGTPAEGRQPYRYDPSELKRLEASYGKPAH